MTNQRVNGRVWNGNIRNRPARKFKTQPSARKTDACSVLGLTRPGTGFQESGTTRNSAQYSEMLTDRLQPAIRSKRRGLLLKGAVLLHENGRPRTAETLRKLKFEVMAHPPYSPDLLWFTQRGIKGPSIHLGSRSNGNGACVARCSAENILFGGHHEACATMDQVR